MEFYHDPVMKNETLEALLLDKKGHFVDCTLGGGGHSKAILERLMGEGMLTAFDRDPAAIAHATERLKEFANKNIVHRRFSEIAEELEANTVDGILCDLGISSRHVDDGSRGFSFKTSTELDLRMNPEVGLDATQWLLETSVEDLTRILSKNADLKKAKRMAAGLKNLAVLHGDKKVPMDALLALIEEHFPEARGKQGSIAARVLQAIRMEINEELFEIDHVIDGALSVLKPGGRLVFLTYHSVEDRLVKTKMKALANPPQPPKHIPVNPKELPQGSFSVVTRKAVAPSDEEIERNPRARSAKMRVYERR